MIWRFARLVAGLVRMGLFGVTQQGSTIASETITNDQEFVAGRSLENHAGGVPTFAFASFGAGPVLTSLRGGAGHCVFRVTSGTGAGAIAANNIQITCSRPPRKVFLAVTGDQTPGFHVASVAGNVINIGTKVADVASTAYDFEMVVLF